MPSLVEDKLLRFLASRVAYECLGACDEAIAASVLEELALYQLMIQYIEAERI